MRDFRTLPNRVLRLPAHLSPTALAIPMQTILLRTGIIAVVALIGFVGALTLLGRPGEAPPKTEPRD